MKERPGKCSEAAILCAVEGRLYEAKLLAEQIPHDSVIYDYTRMVLPNISMGEFYRTLRRIVARDLGPIPNLTLSAGRPSVLNGFRDFSVYGKYLKQLKEPVTNMFRQIYGDAATGIYEIGLAEYLYQQNQCLEALVLVVGALPFLEEKGR